MEQDFEIWMIRVKDDPISEAYASYCLDSWKGFHVNLFDAVTPETIGDNIDHLAFADQKSQTERACFLSQYQLWKQCLEQNKPTLILEHDAYLLRPEYIKYDPRFIVQLFGRFAMEAVMYTPPMVKKMLNLLRNPKNHPIYLGPFGVLQSLCMPRRQYQSMHALPHARFLGPHAPVTCIMDPKIGNTIEHGKEIGTQWARRYQREGLWHQWKQVDLGIDPNLAKNKL